MRTSATGGNARGALPCARASRGSAAAACLLLAACAPSERPLGLVFLSLDTVSARHLSLYGYERETSPELDRFAAEAVVFDHCVANSPWSAPSYLSQFSGLYPLAFRHEPNEGTPMPLHWYLPEAAPSLAEAFHENGYRTAAFVDNPLLSEIGMERGFDVFDTAAAERRVSDVEGGARLLLPRALDWLDDLAPDEPFFLFANLFDVHAPYVAPYVAPDDVQGAFDGEPRRAGERAPVAARHGFIHGAIGPPVAAPFEQRDGPREELPVAPIVGAYDEQVLALDAEIGAFLDALRERGLYDRCVIVVSADHGESWGHRDTYFCHQTVYADDLHVPLIVRLPGGAHGGARVGGDVQLVDLAPTFAECFGLERHPVHGRSLLPAIEGDSLAPAPILSEVPLLEARSIVHDGWKLVRYRLDANTATPLALLSHRRIREWAEEEAPELADGVYGTRGFPDERFVRTVGDALASDPELTEPVFQVFHLEADPREERDLAARRPGRVSELRGMLDGERERALASRDRIGVASPAAADAELLERMRALGYVDDSAGL